MIPITLGIATLLLLGAFQNCQKVGVQFSADNPSSLNSTDGCTGSDCPNSCTATELQTITTPVKLILVVDRSTSNGQTDPHGMRASSIQAFFNDYAGKANFSWSFITFSDKSTSLTSGGFVDKSGMQTAINKFSQGADGGTTSYHSAFQSVSSLLQGDSPTADTKYIVVFMSDGQPRDSAADDCSGFNYYPVDNYCNITSAGAAQVDSDITALVNIRPGQISFNTIYYGDISTAAHDLMASMAVAGQGQFLDRNDHTSSDDFLINNVVTVPGTTCPN